VIVHHADSLLQRATDLAPSFALAEPFPHAVIDGLFDDETLVRALAAFPPADEVAWYKYDNPLEHKLALPHVDGLAPELREVFDRLQSPAFIRFVEVLTGIDGLLPDAELVGAGLHQIEPGGSVAVHVDSNYQPTTMLDRRVNVLVFLNHDWPAEYGGHLELWDAGMTTAVRRIRPVFNRTVIFACRDDANHGHPEPLACPRGRSRKSLATYYYTRGRPEAERSEPHSTVYKRRPQDPDDAGLDALRVRRARGRLEDHTTVDATR
jgi:2OG-Fe(II) oxygenase superfamily